MSWQFQGCLGKEDLCLSELIQGWSTSIAQLGLCTLQALVISSDMLRMVKAKSLQLFTYAKTVHTYSVFQKCVDVNHDFINSCADN